MESNYCTKCGSKISENTNFCGNCGEKITEQEIVNASTTPYTSKKRKAILRTLGKVALWFLGILIIATTILYFMGDDPDTLTVENQNITKDLKVNDLVSVAKTIVPEPFDIINNSISSNGGVISDDEMELHVPAGALQNNERIIVKKIHGQLPIGESDTSKALAEAFPLSPAYDFGPDGILFQKPVIITLKYNEKAIPEGMDEKDVVILYFDGQKWIKVDGEQNEKDNTIFATVNGFPGSLLVVGLVAATAAGYMLDVPAKLKQMIYDPIENNEVHKFIDINNPLVKKHAKGIAIVSAAGKKIISFDDPKALAEYIKKSGKFEFDIGFKKNYSNSYTPLFDKYTSNKQILEPVDNYLKRFESNEEKFGDCIELTNVLVSILRAKGYDIKGVSGYDHGKPHAWAEIMIGEEVYGIDTNGQIRKLAIHMKHLTRPKLGDSYRKEWDEKGTRPYQPTLIIIPPSGDIRVDDNKRYTFHVKTFNLPKDAVFRWKIDETGGRKTKNKSRSFRFLATGKKSLVVTAYWNGQEWSKTYNFNVLGVDQKNQGISQASKSSIPDKIDTKDVDGIAEIEETKETNSGHWVLHTKKFVNGCSSYDSECWPLESCSGGEGSFNIVIGSSTCGSKAAGYSGSGTYTVPPPKLIPGETITFKTTSIGKGYTRVDVCYFDDITKVSMNEYGNNTGDSPSSCIKIVSCGSGESSSQGEYSIKRAYNKSSALRIDAGGSCGNAETSRRYYYLYKWQE